MCHVLSCARIKTLKPNQNLINMYPKSVLFVCLGNICRSPSAEAVMTKLAHTHGLNIRFDSAGTANYHTGKAPDTRAIQVGRSLGFDLSPLRARQVSLQDFYDFEVIFAMDADNLANLQKIAPPDATATLMMFDDIPVADPYYGDIKDFEQMFCHINHTAQKWLATWS